MIHIRLATTLIVLSSLILGASAQNVLIDSINTAHEIYSTFEQKLESIDDQLDSIITRQDTAVLALSRIYRENALEGENNYHMVKSQYYQFVWANKYDFNWMRNLVSAYNSKRLLKQSSGSIELLHLYAKIELLKSQFLERQGERGESIQINFGLIPLLDSLSGTHSSLEITETIFKNFYSISRHYLFENDEISNVYADSCVHIALRSLGNLNIYQAYSLKYYANYYSDDPNILIPIADTCIAYALKLNTPKVLGESYMHKCNALVEANRIDEAFKYCELAEQAYKKVDDPKYLSSVYNNIANVFGKVDAHDKALIFYVRSLDNARRYSDVEQYLNSLYSVAEKNYAMGNYEAAAHHYFMYSDSITKYYTQQLESQFAEAERKFQVSEKEKEISQKELIIASQLNTRRLIITAGILGLAVLSALFFGFYQRTKRKRKENEMVLSEERQRAESLNEVNRLMTTFFNNVTHELRTPLTLIIAPLQDAVRQIKHVKTKENLDLALKNSHRLLSLTNEILDLSKIEAGKLRRVDTSVILKDMMHRIFYSFESYANSRRVILQSEFSGVEGVKIKIDTDKLEKILNNLISNAIKYSHAEGVVKITALVKKEIDIPGLSVIVEDSGPGISKEDLPKLFDRFYQATASGEKMGTGIGLSLVKQLVEFLEGKISASSEIDKGSSFELFLPAEITNYDNTESVEIESNVEKVTFRPVLIDGNKPRILVVEDDIEMSKYLASLLSQVGNCDRAFNGREAIDLLRSTNYDLITSDIMMPEMDGFAFREQINADPRWKDIPFIMLTARILEEDKLRAFQLGIDDYITKPFSSSEIVARISNLISNRIVRMESRSKDNESEDKIEKEDERFVKSAESLVLEHIDQVDYDVSKLATELSLSERQLGRKLNQLTGLSSVAFILEIRLQKAYRLIKEGRFGSINEVRFEVGIESPSYFSRKFKERFGLSPSEMSNMR